ncbi:unnamed protein product [Ixodes pacificus]
MLRDVPQFALKSVTWAVKAYSSVPHVFTICLAAVFRSRTSTASQTRLYSLFTETPKRISKQTGSPPLSGPWFQAWISLQVQRAPARHERSLPILHSSKQE